MATQDNAATTQVPDVFDVNAARRLITTGLRKGFPDGDSSAKRIAREANENHRSVEGWRAGRSLPSLPAFLNLAMKVPGLKSEILRILTSKDEHEIGPDRAIHEIQRVLAAYEGRP